MSQRSTRSHAGGTRNSGLMSAWLFGVVAGVFVLLQAMLPALHGMHHAAHAEAVWSAEAILAEAVSAACDHRVGGDLTGGAREGDDRHQDRDHQNNGCDECKTLLLAKAIGGVLVVAGALHSVEPATEQALRGPDRVTIARYAHGLAARGPPANIA